MTSYRNTGTYRRRSRNEFLALKRFLRYPFRPAAVNTHSLNLEASSSQYANKTSPTNLEITGDMTFEGWVKRESLGLYIFAAYGIGGTDVEANNVLYEMSFSGSDNIRVFHEYDVGVNVDTIFDTKITTLNVWHHIAIVRDATAKTYTLYLNGVSTSVETKGYGNNPTGGTSSQIWLGSAQGGASSFDGLLDDIRIWNDKRTGTEINDNYDIELAGDEAGLVSYWKLNNDYTDKTSSGNDLTAFNSPVFSTDVAFPIAPHSLSLERDLSQYAENTSPTSNLLIAGDMTMEAWVNLESFVDFRYIVTTGRTGEAEADNVQYTYWFDGAGKLNCLHEYDLGTNEQVTFDTVFSLDTWYRITVVRDATAKTYALHINGVSTPTESKSYTNNPTGGSTGDFFVGSLWNIRWYDGLIDDVRIWDDKRTGTEINDNWQIELEGDEAGLVGYWKFDISYKDETSNGNDLTPINLPLFSTDIGYPVYADIELAVIGSVSDSTAKILLRGVEVSSSYFAIEYKTAAQTWGEATITSAITSNADRDYTAVFELTGLSADTVYNYRVYIAGILDSGSTSTFQTFPTEDSSVNFTFAYGADTEGSFRPYTGFASIPDHSPRFYIAEGDQVYADHGITVTDLATFLDKYYQDGVTSGDESLWNEANLRAFFGSTPIFMVADDHEIENDWDEEKTGIYRFGRMAWYIYQISHAPASVNNSNGTCESGTTGTTIIDVGAFADAEVGDTIYNLDQHKITFITGVTDNDTITVNDSGFFDIGDDFVVPQSYYSFKYGDVEFFAIDDISYRSPIGATDDSSKTMLGARQKTWFKDAIKNSTATWKVILSPTPMGGANGGSTHNWSWDAYQTEMAELWDYWFANDTFGIVVLSGDIHASTAWKALGGSPSVAPHDMPWFYDFCTSPLDNSNLSISQNVPDQLYYRNATRYYGVVTVDTTIPNPTFKVEVFAYDDSSTVLESTTILLDSSNKAVGIIIPPTGSLVYTGQAPTILIPVTISIPTGSLIYTGQTPIIIVGVTIAPPTGSLVHTGQVPVILVGDAIVVAPPTGSLVYTGQVPVILTPVTIAIPTGSLAHTGQAPTILTPVVIKSLTGSLVYTGQIPIIALGIIQYNVVSVIVYFTVKKSTSIKFGEVNNKTIYFTVKKTEEVKF